MQTKPLSLFAVQETGYLSKLFIKNMKILGCTFIFCLFFSVQVAAMTGSIRGKVIDAADKKGVMFANVSLKNNRTNEFIKGVATDENGRFVLDNLEKGEYTLHISFIGYTPYTDQISLPSGQSHVELRTIILTEDAHVLEEVQITGQRSQMRFEIDKRVFNVEQNIASTGGSASDVLSNIPSVEVDTEGEISLRGNSSVTVWINGKASGLSADNQAQILEQLPAETIERVEVITNPSAKYNPEGTAGIINIILKQNRKAGYYGSLTAGVDTRGGYNGSGNINYSSGKWETYLNLGYRARKNEGRGYTYRNNIAPNGEILSFLNQQRGNDDKGGNFFGRAGVTWHATTQNHFSINLFGMKGRRESENTILYESNIPGSFIHSTRLSEQTNKMTNASIDFNYIRNFSKTSSLDITVSRHMVDRDGNTDFDQQSVFADQQVKNSFQHQKSEMSIRSWEIQADYVNEFGNSNKIEAGYKANLDRRKSPVETYSGLSEESALFDENLYNHFKYNQDVHALYATYSKRILNFGLQAGLRGEYTKTDTRSLAFGETEEDATPYKNDYFSLYPSAFLSYSLPKNNEIQLNYSRRVSRPWGGQLNPFLNITDSTNISYGNSRLTPEYANALELNFIKNWENHMLSVSLYYRNTDDVIQRISFLDGEVMKSTFENVAKNQAAGTELILKNQFFKFLNLTSTVSLYYNKLDDFYYLPEGAVEAVTGESEEDFAWNARIIANLNLPHEFSLQLTGRYDSQKVVAQGRRKADHTIDAGLKKTFLKRKLSLTVNARDLLNSRKRVTETSGNGFSQKSMYARSGRTVGFTLTYSFGNMKGKRQPQKSSREQMEEEDM